jgi:hypothetical protein
MIHGGPINGGLSRQTLLIAFAIIKNARLAFAVFNKISQPFLGRRFWSVSSMQSIIVTNQSRWACRRIASNSIIHQMGVHG